MKMFLDTNIVRNVNYFGPLFGNLDKLQEKAKIIDIVVPEIVIDEIIDDKYKNFIEQKRDAIKYFDSNQPLKEIGVNLEDIKALSCNLDKKELINSLPFEIEVISPNNIEDAFRKIMDLAVKHKTPFEINGDKGFKDAVIAVTIDEYLKNNRIDEQSILLTNDKRLGEYFDKRSNVVVVDSFKILDDTLQYFPPEERKSTSIAGKISVVESPVRRKIRDCLAKLRNAHSFSCVHDAIGEINTLKSNMTEEDFVDTLLSASNNNQIYMICGDKDVHDYYSDVFWKYGRLLGDEDYNRYVAVMGLDRTLIRQTNAIPDDCPF